MANEVKHGDLTVEQVTDIQKSIITSLRSKDSFWDKFCSHDDKVNDGYSDLEWRKLNIPELTVAELSNLQEGVTPAGLSMTYVKFKTSPVDFGSYIPYTDKSAKYNFDDVRRDAKTILSQRAFDEVELRKALQFVAGTCTISMSTGNNAFLKTCLRVKTILKRNGVKPVRGNRFACVLPSEYAAQVLLDYENQITHTSQKEAVIDGYLGELGGFILFETTSEVVYGERYAKTSDVALDESKTYYTVSNNVYTAVAEPAVANIGSYYEKIIVGKILFMGKTEDGMPVRTTPFGDASVKIIEKPLGSIPYGVVDSNGKVTEVRGDNLEQRGSVGYKVMGFATRILHDEAILRATVDLAGIDELDVVDANRQHYQGSSTSPIVG